jgi:hypothetical protein
MVEHHISVWWVSGMLFSHELDYSDLKFSLSSPFLQVNTRRILEVGCNDFFPSLCLHSTRDHIPNTLDGILNKSL